MYGERPKDSGLLDSTAGHVVEADVSFVLRAGSCAQGWRRKHEGCEQHHGHGHRDSCAPRAVTNSNHGGFEDHSLSPPWSLPLLGLTHYSYLIESRPVKAWRALLRQPGGFEGLGLSRARPSAGS